MRQDIAVAPYTKPGDPLKIDCGYRPNGVIHLFHALSLATDVNSAKVLAFSYSDMRDGLSNAEHAMSDLTVVTEDQLDASDKRSPSPSQPCRRMKSQSPASLKCRRSPSTRASN